MKDLYHRLGVDPYAAEEAIRDALRSRPIDPDLRADIEAALLDRRHRPRYDRVHRLLTTIGALRTRLDLQLRPFWAYSANQDFTIASALLESPAPAKPRRRLPWITAAVLAAVVMGVCLLWWRSHHK